MVCSVQMAVMASLSASQVAAEKAEHQKIVVQYIQKELLECDEPNMLDEEDMHIFGLNPLTDPLCLVSCEMCKKPVKASQFVFHSELCRSLGITEQISEFDSGTINRKPPRKERKKAVSSGKRVTLTEGKERIANVDASVTPVSSSQLDGPIGISSSCSVETKEVCLTSIGTRGKMGGSARGLVPLTKRLKSVVDNTAQPTEEIQMARGVSNTCSIQNQIPYIPKPLATKIYTSQRNNRLRAAITYMYNQSLVNQGCINERESQGNLVISEASSIGSAQQLNSRIEKSSDHSSLNAIDTNQTFEQVSTSGLSKPGGQTSNFVNNFPIVGEYSSEGPVTTTITTSYHANPYPFVANSDYSRIMKSQLS